MSHGREARTTALSFQSTWPAGRISTLLTIVALVLWSYSITQARFEIGFYGLVGGLPVSFFLALGILTIASAILWLSKEDHGGLLFLQLCVLIVAIWSVPLIVRGSPQGSLDIYTDRGFIEYVTESGHFSASANWTFNWPLGWVFWAMIGRLSGATHIPIVNSWLPLMPLIWQFTILPVLYLFFRNTIGRVQLKYCWAALWVFYVGNWFEVLNTGAQSFGVFFLFALMAMLSMTPAWEGRATALGTRLSAIIILAASTVAHLLGAMVAVAVTAGVGVTKKGVKLYGLILLAVVLLTAWTVYGSSSYLEYRLPSFLGQGMRVDVATQRGILNPLSGDAAHAAVAGIRIVLTGLLCLAAGLGGIMGWKLRDNRRADMTVLFICVACGIAAISVGSSYKAELYQRFYVILLPAIAYFGVKLLRWKATATILVLVLLATIPLTLVAKYGNQKLDYMSPAYLRGAEAFYDNTYRGEIVAVLPIGRMDDFDEYGRGDVTDYSDLQFADAQIAVADESGVPWYVFISNHERAWYGFFLNEPQLIDDVEGQLDTATNVDLVYANPDLSLYVHERRG